MHRPPLPPGDSCRRRSCKNESASSCKDIGSHCWRLPSNCPCKEQQQVVDGGGGRRTQLNGRATRAFRPLPAYGIFCKHWWELLSPQGIPELRSCCRDETHRPPEARSPIDPSILEVEPQEDFNLDVDLLLKNLRTAPRGAAAGPSGMTAEHSKPADTTRVAGQFASDARGGIAGGESWSDDSFGQARRRSARHCGRSRFPDSRGAVYPQWRKEPRTGSSTDSPYAREPSVCVARVVQALSELDPPFNHFVNVRSGCVRQRLPGRNLPGCGGHATWRKVDPVHRPVLFHSFEISVGK